METSNIALRLWCDIEGDNVMQPASRVRGSTITYGQIEALQNALQKAHDNARNHVDQLEQSIAARHAETIEARREAGDLRTENARLRAALVSP